MSVDIENIRNSIMSEHADYISPEFRFFTTQSVIAMVEAAILHPIPRDNDDWAARGADYDGTACSHCSRQRVLRYDNGRRICEKCNWDQASGDYASDHERIG